MTDLKPLNWTPKPGVGMTVARRSDGGMALTFTDLSEATVREWRDFALEHLLGSDRRTRNLYDLRAVKDISEKAVRAAGEVNSDPSPRNLRLAGGVGAGSYWAKAPKGRAAKAHHGSLTEGVEGLPVILLPRQDKNP